jgi:hypothetical protein
MGLAHESARASRALDGTAFPGKKTGEHMRADYVTSFWRVVLAYLGGALTGGVVFFLEVVAMLALRPGKLDQISEFAETDSTALIVSVALAGLLFFAGGLLVVGGPSWFILHRLGRRDWYYATVLGAVLGAAGFVAFALTSPEWDGLRLISALTEEYGGLTASNGKFTAEGWAALERGAAGIALAGGLAGLALWRIAYRKRRA